MIIPLFEINLKIINDISWTPLFHSSFFKNPSSKTRTKKKKRFKKKKTRRYREIIAINNLIIVLDLSNVVETRGARNSFSTVSVNRCALLRHGRIGGIVTQGGRRVELIPFEIRGSWFGFKDALIRRQRYPGYSDQTFHSDTRWKGNGSGMFQFSKLREREKPPFA